MHVKHYRFVLANTIHCTVSLRVI